MLGDTVTLTGLGHVDETKVNPRIQPLLLGRRGHFIKSKVLVCDHLSQLQSGVVRGRTHHLETKVTIDKAT